MTHISRRELIQGTSAVALAGAATLSVGQSSAFAAEDAKQLAQANVAKQIDLGEIYIPTATETLEITGSQDAATSNEKILKRLSRSQLKKNEELRKVQEKLTYEFREEYQQAIQSSDLSASYAQGSSAYGLSQVEASSGVNAVASGTTNRYFVKNANGQSYYYSHNGILPTNLHMYARALQANWSRGRCYVFDPNVQGSWWSVWRYKDSNWHYFPTLTGASGTLLYSTVTQVERYNVTM